MSSWTLYLLIVTTNVRESILERAFLSIAKEQHGPSSRMWSTFRLLRKWAIFISLTSPSTMTTMILRRTVTSMNMTTVPRVMERGQRGRRWKRSRPPRIPLQKAAPRILALLLHLRLHLPSLMRCFCVRCISLLHSLSIRSSVLQRFLLGSMSIVRPLMSTIPVGKTKFG